MPKAALVVFAFGLALIVFPPTSFASIFTLSPTGLQANSNSTIDLKVNLNTMGEQVNAFTAALVFPADKLTIDTIDYDLSTFPIGADETKSDGQLKFSRGSIFGASGDLSVATIHFKTKASGTAAIKFTKDSAVPKSSDNSDSFDLGNSIGSTVTIAEGATNPSPTTTPNPNSSGSSQNQVVILTAEQLKSCQAKKEALKLRLNSILDLASALKVRFDNIDSLLETYITSQLVPKKTVNNLVNLQSNIKSKKQSAEGKIASLRKDVAAFSCENGPKESLTNFKGGIKNLKLMLADYQLADKNLLTAVKAAH